MRLHPVRRAGVDRGPARNRMGGRGLGRADRAPTPGALRPSRLRRQSPAQAGLLRQVHRHGAGLSEARHRRGFLGALHARLRPDGPVGEVGLRRRPDAGGHRPALGRYRGRRDGVAPHPTRARATSPPTASCSPASAALAMCPSRSPAPSSKCWRSPATAFARALSYWARNPPSITSSAPVTKLDSSEARYRMP